MATGKLSKDRIVEAAIDILDVEGESALTFRTLASRLATGSGALYWHIANKDELLDVAATEVISRVLAGVVQAGDSAEAIRAIASGVFDAIDAHPWVGTQLLHRPWQSAMLQVFEAVGSQVQALGVAPESQFHCASAIVSYLLGLAGQYAAAARVLPRDADRNAFLAKVAAQWTRYDPADYPFVHQVAAQLPEHDDREQFLAGIDLILAGITA